MPKGVYLNPNYMKEYREKNREHLLEYNKLSYKQTPDAHRMYAHAYYKKNREKILQQNKIPEFKHKRNLRNKQREKICIDTWRGFIPHEIQCPCCGKTVFFASGVSKNSIHFDHRKNGSEFIKQPSRWLALHKRNLENELIWKSCDFGMLCKSCNGYLPTNNRIDFVRNVVKYVGGI